MSWFLATRTLECITNLNSALTGIGLGLHLSIRLNLSYTKDFIAAPDCSHQMSHNVCTKKVCLSSEMQICNCLSLYFVFPVYFSILFWHGSPWQYRQYSLGLCLYAVTFSKQHCCILFLLKKKTVLFNVIFVTYIGVRFTRKNLSQ